MVRLPVCAQFGSIRDANVRIRSEVPIASNTKPMPDRRIRRQTAGATADSDQHLGMVAFGIGVAIYGF
jgi:hypothetical protein